MRMGDQKVGELRDEIVDVVALSKIAERVSASVPLAQLLEEVHEFVIDLIDCDLCLIYVLDGDDLVLRTSKKEHRDAIDRIKVEVGQEITGWVARHQAPVVIAQSAYQDPRFQLFSQLPEDRFEAFLSVPMVSGGRLVGVINIQNRLERWYSSREIGILRAIGFLIGSEVEQARLRSENQVIEQKLEEREVFERAKKILQRQRNISEEEAYLILQRESRRRRKPFKEIAESILLAEDLKTTFMQGAGTPFSEPAACLQKNLAP